MKNDIQIQRREFLKNLGFKGSALVALYCGGVLSACTNEAMNPSSTSQFSLNLDEAENAKLKTSGGYIIKNNVVIAKTMQGEYIAATLICSHEQRKQITFTTNNEFYCTAHDARFDKTGKGLNSNGKKNLAIYPTMLMDGGKTLMVG